jgi:hypothetical protein
LELLLNPFLFIGEDVADLRESLLGMGAAAAAAAVEELLGAAADAVEATTASLLCLHPIMDICWLLLYLCG